MNQMLISAAHKSSGKTLVSIGLCAALKQRGHLVQPYKKGPDYIDPIWLSQAAGRACRNLDLYLMEQNDVVNTFEQHRAGINLVEGNKGLYDGLALDGSNSNAALAKLLDLPVFLVIDARGMTRGIAPLILGYQAFDPDIHIAGVILNNLGGSRHEAKLRSVIEHYTHVPVIGAIHHDAELGIVERHLGLMPSNESEVAAAKIQQIGEVIARQVNLDQLLALSTKPEPTHRQTETLHFPSAQKVRIAVAMDRAFGFYYADDMDALVAAGAEILPFDALHDTQLPENIDALYIGGGFPEMCAAELAANVSLRQQIQQLITNGLPTYAECGGLMYLSRSITYQDQTFQMVGAIQGDIQMHKKPIGRGYVHLVEQETHPWPRPAQPAQQIKAHEFHYSSLENLPADSQFAYHVARGHGIDGQQDGLIVNNLLASYTHLRTIGQCYWATRFVAFIRQTQQGAIVTPFQAAIAAFDAANAQDPNQEIVDGQAHPKELLYAQRMTDMQQRYAPEASEAVKLAVRAQHIQRWKSPRSDYPMDKKGYMLWRTQLYKFHAETAGALMKSVGYDDDMVERVKTIVSKKDLKTNPETQMMEDVVDLVFIEHYMLAFAGQHAEYDEEKWILIIRKTWQKMSARAHEFALAGNIKLPEALIPLILKAVQA
jgi:cobyrinic acid a,c-diamide synthase